MLKTPDWAAGAKYLREHAPELIPLIDRFPVWEFKPEPKEKYFGTLVTGIVSQQLPPDVSLPLPQLCRSAVTTVLSGSSSACSLR
mgnify:CR=1 FL=1